VSTPRLPGAPPPRSACVAPKRVLWREHGDRQAVTASCESVGLEPLRFDEEVGGVIIVANLAGLDEASVDGVTSFNDQVKAYTNIPDTSDRTDNDGGDWYPKGTDGKVLQPTHAETHPPDRHDGLLLPPPSGSPSRSPDPTADAGLACAGPLLDALKATRTRPVVRQEGPQGPSSVPGEIQFRVAVILQLYKALTRVACLAAVSTALAPTARRL
jgi:hypothetical protein